MRSDYVNIIKKMHTKLSIISAVTELLIPNTKLRPQYILFTNDESQLKTFWCAKSWIPLKKHKF